ncbi:hypothetical protein MMC28_004882 [Mycoblastus sanguinarius]|nr:hypothetical protein [Mycoblastus sanguinarius]
MGNLCSVPHQIFPLWCPPGYDPNDHRLARRGAPLVAYLTENKLTLGQHFLAIAIVGIVVFIVLAVGLAVGLAGEHRRRKRQQRVLREEKVRRGAGVIVDGEGNGEGNGEWGWGWG